MMADLFQTGLAVTRMQDIALSVLATVIGHQAEKNWVIADAGWMAMSRDRGTAKQRVDQGYGVVCDLDGRPLDGSDLIIVDANEEHGILAHRNGRAIKAEAFPVGSRVRILPNHACATGAQHDRFHAVDADRPGEIIAQWSSISGW